MRKINFLVIAVFSILVILIVNAAEEKTNEGYNQSNENSSFNTAALESNENLVNETSNFNNSNASEVILNNSLEINNTSVYEESQYDINNKYNINNNSNENSDDLINKNVSNKIVSVENEKQGKAVTASFGVCLEIVG